MTPTLQQLAAIRAVGRAITDVILAAGERGAPAGVVQYQVGGGRLHLRAVPAVHWRSDSSRSSRAPRQPPLRPCVPLMTGVTRIRLCPGGMT